jgi:hypothetical protein
MYGGFNCSNATVTVIWTLLITHTHTGEREREREREGERESINANYFTNIRTNNLDSGDQSSA